jgi:hypothetical protein
MQRTKICFVVLGCTPSWHFSFYSCLLMSSFRQCLCRCTWPCRREWLGYSTATIAPEDATANWIVVLCGYCHFGYILRCIWIKWEIFLPSCCDFLERGDFGEEKYKEQYQKTCLVENLSMSHKQEKAVYTFFDIIFPGKVRCFKVLLNTESLQSLIKWLTKHIMDYVDVFFLQGVQASCVFAANRSLWEDYQNAARLLAPRKPKETRINFIQHINGTDMGNIFFQPQSPTVRDSRTYKAREWYHQ